MADYPIFISIDGTETAIKSLEDLNKATQELAKGFEEAGDAADDAAKKTEEAGSQTGFLQEKYNDLSDTVGKLKADFKLATGGIKTFFTTGTTGAKALKIAFASTGIGLLIIAIVSLIDYFKDTEEGSRALTVAFEASGVIINKLIDWIAMLGGKLISAFSDPVETIKNFANTLKQFVIDRVQQIINGIGLLGKAISQVFQGEFAAAADTASEALNELFMVDEIAGAIDAAGDFIVDTFNEIADAVTSAVTATNNLVKAQRSLRDMQQKLTVENAELNKTLEVNQKIAEDTTLAYDERAAALDKVNEANIQLASNAAALAAKEESVLKQELALASSYEQREEIESRLSEAVAKRIDTETQLELKKQDAAKLSRELEQEELDRVASINDTLAQLRLDNVKDEEEAALEGLRIAEEATLRELELKRATEEQLLEAQRLFEEQRTKVAQEFADERTAKAKEEADKQAAIDKERAETIVAAEEALQAAKLDAFRGGLAAVAQLAGNNEKLQNALFVVDQAVAAGQVILGAIKEKAANAAYAATLGPAGPAYLIPANAATNIRAGVSLATIAATTIGKLRGSKQSTLGVDTPATGTGGINPGAITYNLGAGGGGADVTLNNQQQSQPIKAYVIANDVTSAQQANAQIDNLSKL